MQRFKKKLSEIWLYQCVRRCPPSPLVNKGLFVAFIQAMLLDYNISLLGAGIIFLILAHPVYKMWVIQEANTLELLNKVHFDE